MSPGAAQDRGYDTPVRGGATFSAPAAPRTTAGTGVPADRCPQRAAAPSGAAAPLLLSLLRTLPRLLPCLGLLLCTGCLIPLPLDAENTVDSGRLLLITDATMPPFGTQVAMRQDAEFDYTLDVRSDSRTIAARLYVQINGNCCDLDVTDPQKIHFLQDAFMVTEVEPGRFRVGFIDVRPCYHVPPRATAYVIPAVATGGFVGGPTERLEAVGTLSKDHYWSVQCQ